MTSSLVRAFGLFASVLVAGVAGAQATQVVEWKVSEGGNGHWYQTIRAESQITWFNAEAAAKRIGGMLACFETQTEWDALRNRLDLDNNLSMPRGWGPWAGGWQVSTSPDAPWMWVSGDPWSFAAWSSGQPDNNCIENSYPNKTEEHLSICSTGWNDLPNSGCDKLAPVAYVVEWASDCNGDGIVDYGQIRGGQLIDDNANGIPDICETSITGVIPPSVPAQGGAAISINGRNFPAQPTVLVGGVAATDVVRVSETRLTATSPALLPGMASVSVNGFTLADGIYIRPECGSDLDQDGEVTASDIAIVLLDFGPCYVTATSPQADDSTPFMLQEQPAPEAPQSR